MSSESIEVPAHYLCPITDEVMTNPVRAVENQTIYDKQAITAWLLLEDSWPGTDDMVDDDTLVDEAQRHQEIHLWLNTLSPEDKDYLIESSEEASQNITRSKSMRSNF